MQGNILIIDDERFMTDMLSILLGKQGYETLAVSSAAQARKNMATFCPDLALLDLILPDGHGADLMVDLAKLYPAAKFIIITGHGSIRSAVETTQTGAEDYLEKPFEPERLLLAVRNAMKDLRLNEELNLHRLRTNRPLHLADDKDPASQASAEMQRVYELAQMAADSGGSVLLLGETGAGKDFMAKWIHNHSPRRDEPFFSVNCSAISRELSESELFGHEPGAFTGAKGRKLGMLELAQRGTLLLNEIGELDLATQSKLLTFLDTKAFLRIGGQKYISVDTHIIAATNRDLQQQVEEGRFRQDLFFRINVFPITIPPLRERRSDLPALINDLLWSLQKRMGLKRPPKITNLAMEVLRRYAWPGNVRELQNILERAIILCPDKPIGHETFAGMLEPAQEVLPQSVPRSLKETLADTERELILSALASSRTRQEAAKKLQITRHSLTYKMKVLDIASDEPE